jgi:hypothetical protein
MGFVDKLARFGTGFAEGMEPGMRMGMQIGRERRINKQQQQANKSAAENRILNLLPNNREGAYALLEKGIGSGIIDENFRAVMDENVAGMDERASRRTMGQVSPSITRAGQATGPGQTVTGEGDTAFDVTTPEGISQAVTEATTDVQELGTAVADIEGRDFTDIHEGLKKDMTDAEFRKLQAKTAKDEQVRRLAQLNRISPVLNELMSENIGNSIAARQMIYDKLKGLYANLYKEGEGGEKTERAMRKVKHMRRDYDEAAFDEIYSEWDSGNRTVDGFLEIMTSPYSYTNRQLKFMLPEVMREATTRDQAEALVDINYVQSMMKSAAATGDPAMVTKASENLMKELKGNPNVQALVESSLPMYQQDAFQNKNNNKTANLKTVIDLYTSDEALANLRNTGQEVLGKFYGGKATGVGTLAESLKDNMPDDLLKILKGPIPNIQDIHLEQLATVMTERQIKTGESTDSKAPTTPNTGLYSDEAIKEREEAGKIVIPDDASVIDAYFTMSSSPFANYDLSEGAGVHLDDIAPERRTLLAAGLKAAYTDPQADKQAIEIALAKRGIELIIDSKGVPKLRAIEPVEPMLKEVTAQTTEPTNPLPGVLPTPQ